MKTFAVAAALSLAASTVQAGSVQARDDVTPVTVKGNAFFKGDERFYIRGVDYQPGGSSNVQDPIADVEGCKRDIPKFKQLGLNTVRVYSIDNSKNHDECMNALADAGIYLALDVNTPEYAINRAKPKPSYNAVYLQYIFATVEKFAQYKNTLLFFSGNEVVNDKKSSSSAPYVKAVTRDLRNYIRSRNLRKIPVGYSAADVSSNRLQMAHYMNCGPDEERSDFFAFNDYSWCSPSSFTKAGWDQKVKKFSDYGLPLFLSEYGCNTNDREFGEVEALYSKKMTPVYSGGLVYEYSEEPSNYGLVNVKGPSKLEELDDFDTLAKAFNKTDSPDGDGGYNKTGGASTCPEKELPAWDVNSEAPLPKMPSAAKKYMKEGAGEAPGFSGPGSMTAGRDSTPSAEPGSTVESGSSGSGSGSDSDSSEASSSSSSAAAAPGAPIPSMSLAPALVGLVTVVSSLFGASLILV